MNIWLPNAVYQALPLLSVLTGFSYIALMPNPFGVLVASFMYVYSFWIMWLRLSDGDNESQQA